MPLNAPFGEKGVTNTQKKLISIGTFRTQCNSRNILSSWLHVSLMKWDDTMKVPHNFTQY